MRSNLIEEFQERSMELTLPTLNKFIICAYGMTGSGKSTIINYILRN